jgi:hypothetical protein
VGILKKWLHNKQIRNADCDNDVNTVSPVGDREYTIQRYIVPQKCYRRTYIEEEQIIDKM